MCGEAQARSWRFIQAEFERFAAAYPSFQLFIFDGTQDAFLAVEQDIRYTAEAVAGVEKDLPSEHYTDREDSPTRHFVVFEEPNAWFRFHNVCSTAGSYLFASQDDPTVRWFSTLISAAHQQKEYGEFADFVVSACGTFLMFNVHPAIASALLVEHRLSDDDAQGTGGGSIADADILPQYVELGQMAAIIQKSKRTLEKWKSRAKNPLPPPDIEGGGGTADEWDWSTIRPWLEEESGRKLPARFPTIRPALTEADRS